MEVEAVWAVMVEAEEALVVGVVAMLVMVVVEVALVEVEGVAEVLVEGVVAQEDHLIRPVHNKILLLIQMGYVNFIPHFGIFKSPSK